jgi:multimeric flavodoxin WrbA
MINVLGISASPRKGGNSAFLLGHALDGAREAYPSEVTTIAFGFPGKTIAHCNACDACNRNGGRCTIDDDFQELVDLWVDADAIIYSTPVYHMALPSQLRAFMDRLGTSTLFRFGEEPDEPTLRKLLKPVGVIAQGNGFSSGQEQAMQQVVAHAVLMGCVPVIADGWEASLGVAGSTNFDVDRGAIERQAASGEALAEATVHGARALGRSAVEMALLLHAGAAARDDVMAGNDVYGELRRRVAEGPSRRFAERAGGGR